MPLTNFSPVAAGHGFIACRGGAEQAFSGKPHFAGVTDEGLT